MSTDCMIKMKRINSEMPRLNCKNMVKVKKTELVRNGLTSMRSLHVKLKLSVHLRVPPAKAVKPLPHSILFLTSNLT